MNGAMPNHGNISKTPPTASKGGYCIQMVGLKDESISLLRLDFIEASTLIVVLIISWLIITGCKSLMINFVMKYAPKDRPINTLMLFDQVTIHAQSIKVPTAG